MKFKGDLKVLGGIAAGQYLTIDPIGNILGSISSGGSGGGGDLIYQGNSIPITDGNYIPNNYYEIDAGAITTEQINGVNGTVPELWNNPFIIDNPTYNFNYIYITKSMKVKITNITDSTEYIGTIEYEAEQHYIEDVDGGPPKIIYNFIDDNIDSPVQLSNTNSYKLYLLLYNIQPAPGSLNKNNYSGSSTSTNIASNDYNTFTINAGGITPGQSNSDAGPVPEFYNNPFIINDPNLNNNFRYITNNMKVEIIKDNQTFRGTLNFDTAYVVSGKQIYNFTDDNTETPLILDHETSTYILTLLLSQVYAGGITPGQLNSDAGPVPEFYSDPFIINDPNLNNNSTYIINNMIVVIINPANGDFYIGILNFDPAYMVSGKQIYNFTDNNNTETPVHLDHETLTYELYLYTNYQEPAVNSASVSNKDIIITKTPLSGNEYLNIKLNTNTMETYIPGIFKIFIINTANLNMVPQQFSYPPLYDDNGNSLSIITDTFINIFDGDQYILVTNFPIIQTNITIVSYVSPP